MISQYFTAFASDEQILKQLLGLNYVATV